MFVSAFGPPAKQVRIALDPGSIAAWEIAAMEARDLDEAAGVRLKVRKVADGGAGQELLRSGRVDVILSDVVWASRQREEGADFTFVPVGPDPSQALAPALLGWVFSEAWAAQNPESIGNFLDASAAARQALISDDGLWDEIRAEMGAVDDVAFLAWRDAYRAGAVADRAEEVELAEGTLWTGPGK